MQLLRHWQYNYKEMNLFIPIANYINKFNGGASCIQNKNIALFTQKTWNFEELVPISNNCNTASLQMINHHL